MRKILSLFSLLLVVLVFVSSARAEYVEEFADLSLNPTMLTTAPCNAPTSTGPGVVVVPAPGTGKMLLPLRLLAISEDATYAWGSNPRFDVTWGSPAGAQVFSTTIGGMSQNVSEPNIYPYLTLGIYTANQTFAYSAQINSPLVISTTSYIKSFNLALKAVNQGTKTFTFIGAVSTFTPGM